MSDLTLTAAPTLAESALPPRIHPARAFWRRYRQNWLAVVGLVVVLGFIVVGLFAPWLAPYSYTDQDLTNSGARPNWEHPLGTDRLGRDQLSRLIWGARTALIIAPATVLMSFGIGIFMGLLAGYVGGWADALVMRVSDVLFAFPGLLFALFVAATIQPRVEAFLGNIPAFDGLVRAGYAEFFVVVAALSVVGWPGLARLVRGQVLALREQPFIEAARATGVPALRILTHHLLPNAMPPVIVAASMGLGGAIIAESTLSFFGIGIQPPTPSWGAMIFANLEFWRRPEAPWMVWLPGLIVGLLAFSFNFIGDGLNDALDARRE